MARFLADLIYKDLINKHGNGIAMVINMAMAMVLKVCQDLVIERGLGKECEIKGSAWCSRPCLDEGTWPGLSQPGKVICSDGTRQGQGNQPGQRVGSVGA